MISHAEQSPLLETALSVEGVRALRERPRAVVLGIGLSARGALSSGLPFDTLGMLLAAEQLRRIADARELVALIADEHALTNGFPESEVELRAREVERQLQIVRRALALPLRIVRGAELHRTRAHRELVARLRTRVGAAHPYVLLEVADIECLRRKHGTILKLGWARDARVHGPSDAQDERLFDRCFRTWIGGDVGFTYVRAGRTLDVRRPFAAPYLVLDHQRRLLLSEHECGAKLERFLAEAPRDARMRVLGHLRRITREFARAIAPIEGSVAERVRAVLDHIYRQAQPTESLS